MKQAFTLAEVLLTLAIIGVVSALTIPAVITKVQKDQYVAGLRKAFNTLKLLEQKAILEHGEIKNWDWTKNVTDNFNTYWKPHFDILKDCGATTDSGCFHGENETKELSGSVRSANYNSTSAYKFITSDGIAYAYLITGLAFPQRRAYFVVDVNGKKAPNTVGRDIYIFHVFTNAGLKPDGTLTSSDENVKIDSDMVDAASDGGCSTMGGAGWFCAAKVLSEGAMNY